MKKQNEKKLFLNKEIVTCLTPAQQSRILGGGQTGVKTALPVPPGGAHPK
jgi:hypothetical protein